MTLPPSTRVELADRWEGATAEVMPARAAVATVVPVATVDRSAASVDRRRAEPAGSVARLVAAAGAAEPAAVGLVAAGRAAPSVAAADAAERVAAGLAAAEPVARSAEPAGAAEPAVAARAAVAPVAPAD